MQAGVIVFTKNPVAGKVKTRLAATVGDQQALRIYQALLTHTRDVVLQVNAKRLLFYSEEIIHQDTWPVAFFDKMLQHPGDLGQRMASAFKVGFHTAQPLVIVGSDCAQLRPSIIEKALALLATHEMVIGPAMDGGYYLLGMKNFHPEVFDGIAWSTPQVLEQTLHIIEQQGWSYAIVDTLSDIDTEADWKKYGWILPDNE
ncbi:MAG: TIGR04282 family arsenosugar biosynthesis glycosyltransferase [Saprospiraceae bacterium]